MTSDTRFMAFVALSEPSTVSATALAERVTARFRDKIPFEFKVPSPGAAGIILDIDGVLITVLQIDKPLPPDAYAQALALNRTWKGAEAALSAQRAHAIVATLSPIGSHADALNGAAYTTLVAAALMDLTRPISVVWTTGDALSEASEFQKAADSVAARQLPVLTWLSLIILAGPPLSDGRPTVAMATTGLLPFVGLEIEFEPTVWPPVQVADRVLGTAQYLMARGMVVKDGDTLGATEVEKIDVRFANGRVRARPTVLLRVCG